MSTRPPQHRADFSRRLVLVFGAASLPVLGGVLTTAHGDTGDAGASVACFAWGGDDEECPAEDVATARFNRSETCVTEVTSWGEYDADEETCCYTIARECTYAPLGFGCSHVPAPMAPGPRLR